MVSVSVVVPCYRSTATLPDLIEQLLPVLSSLSAEHEVILVVDGSPDDTAATATALARRHAGIEVLEMARNYGQHNALLAGIRAARHDVVVTMDDDLQHRPATVPDLVAALTPDLDLVYGTAAEEEHGFWRSAASRLVKRMMAAAMDVTSADQISAFRAFRRSLVDGLAGLDGPHVSIDVGLTWATTRIGSVKVPMDARMEGRSNYSFRMLVRHALNMLLGYSTAPLRFAGYLGLLCGIVGLSMLVVVLLQYFFGATKVQGYTAIASMVSLFSGAQLVAVGVIGEYLARIHSHSMGKPAYVVKARMRTSGPTADRDEGHARS